MAITSNEITFGGGRRASLVARHIDQRGRSVGDAAHFGGFAGGSPSRPFGAAATRRRRRRKTRLK